MVNTGERVGVPFVHRTTASLASLKLNATGFIGSSKASDVLVLSGAQSGKRSASETSLGGCCALPAQGIDNGERPLQF